ncbi:unnamed protein product [Ectocarpus sp. 6 AP-2014]
MACVKEIAQCAATMSIPCFKEMAEGIDPSVVNVLALVGGLVLVRSALSVLASVFTTFLRPGKDLKKYGAWAVVTGATDGIGKAMAYQMAKKGMNVLLISRTETKLVDAETEIKAACPSVEVAHLAIDYSNFDATLQAKVAAAIADKDVGILVNNVGVSYPFPKYFDELTDDEMKSLLEMNVNSTVWMTRLALPGMVARKRGAIVNFGSAAALNPSALLAGYSGAKGFILKMTESMHVEMAAKGIHVQCQVPLLVATKLAKIRRASLTAPSPATYAKAGVGAIGYGAVVSPYWAHKLQLFALSVIPWSEAVVFNMHKGLRARALKKLASKKD